MIELSTLLKPHRDIRFRIIDGEAVVLQQRDARILSLNETGTCILGWLDGTRTVKDLINQLSEEYEASTELLEADVLAYLGELEAMNIIEPVYIASDMNHVL